MDTAIYRKTDAGHAEVRDRRLGLDARVRGLLILVNGQLSVGDLARRVGFDPGKVLVQLVTDRLIELVAAPARPRTALRPAPPPPPPPPAPKAAPPRPMPPPVAAAELMPADLDAAKRRVVPELLPHYGPDALMVAETLLKVGTPQAFAVALQAVQERLSVATGKRLAAEVCRAIAHGP